MGTVDISEGNVSADDIHEKRPFSFSIVLPGNKRFWIQASGLLEKKRWIDALLTHVAGGGENMEESLQFDDSDIALAMSGIYMKHILPLEQRYIFDRFYSEPFKEIDFTAPPMVLLLGQYSVGKTTFIQYILGKDFPGIHIGPEPTTDRFIAVMHGDEDKAIPGSAASIDQSLPYTGLQSFGGSFLDHFQVSKCNAEILKKVNFIDTPGILSGEKQRINRQYDYPQTISWFAERASMIILFFDPHKLDISDEFSSCIQEVTKYPHKMRIVINKSDELDSQHLLRVYGALMYSLGKVLTSPEVSRVYLGSFQNFRPLNECVHLPILLAEQQDLLDDLFLLHTEWSTSRVNELVQRLRRIKIHACIMCKVKDQLPMFSKHKKLKSIYKKWDTFIEEVSREYKLPINDLPDREVYKSFNDGFNPDLFSKVSSTRIEAFDYIIEHGLSRIMDMVALKRDPDHNPFNDAIADDENEGNPFSDSSGESNSINDEAQSFPNVTEDSFEEHYDGNPF
eukprot:TRINITY_DN7118_c0_g1_i2.p1 TRINITY_DN7118_c0_g1~~TRINITY_DN7118_c0_g1_i2.p1  ORF type:complete len:509 (+),score=112.37 TRINITY_DN7118_c0_g1_i2:126-1652(+)